MKRLKWITGIMAALLFIGGAVSFIGHNTKDHELLDDRFITYNNGTVLDTSTGLMWAASDNGSAAAWKEAKEYCENHNAGGYTDWRMPTVEELKSLYDGNEPGYRPECAVYDWKVYLTDKIHLSGASPWASADHGAEAECFMFDYGCRSRMFKSVNFIMRALPVRNFSAS
jgi:hypothetical protein